MQEQVQHESSDDRIDRICDEFEEAWCNEARPDLRCFLSRGLPADREALFVELLLVEIDYRFRSGQTPVKSDYLEQFAEFSHCIESLVFKCQLNDDEFPHSNEPASAPTRTSRLLHFRLIECIGKGAGGEVWKAQDTRLERNVAVKIAHPGNLGNDGVHRFLREAKAAASLRHPNIVSVYEAGRDGGTAFIVSELINGETLRQRMSTKPLSYDEAAHLCLSISEALHFAHGQGIVHRDLKPANILLGPEGEPHIADFGLAKWAGDSGGITLNGQLVGTLAYMSPEQACGESFRVDRRSDIFALGVILYEMITLQLPFTGEPAAVLNAIIHKIPPTPRSCRRSVPRDLETICLKALEKDVSRRYESARDMADDLRRYLKGISPLARRVSLFERTRRWLWRHPAITSSIVLTIIVFGAGFAIYCLREQNLRLQGYRSVLIETSPAGARLAVVPIDGHLQSSSKDGIRAIYPEGRTPLTISLRPGDYLIEAAVEDQRGDLQFAEAYRTITPQGTAINDVALFNTDSSKQDQSRIHVRIHPVNKVIANMIRIPISKELQLSDSLLPSALYVDANQTSPVDHLADNSTTTQKSEVELISLADAKRLAEKEGKRLLTESEYRAIRCSLSNQENLESVVKGGPLIEELSDNIAEWTTTTYNFPGVGSASAIAHLRSLYVLEGYGDPKGFEDFVRSPQGQLIATAQSSSPKIGFRGARSEKPRFLKP
jgi:serine/threonine protein kinase